MIPIGLFLTCAILIAAKKSGEEVNKIELRSEQASFLRLEPILVTVSLPVTGSHALPAPVGDNDAGSLRFEISPQVEARSGARPLPLERNAEADGAKVRDYDLLEWYQFPGQGEFTVQAVFENDEKIIKSEPLSIRISTPKNGDPEAGPVDRIHHTPWCNYDTNKFCGDTFDLTNRWPDSKLTKYCHYWNGRYSQNQGEFDEAINSYQTVIKNYPKFALADDAAFGIVECLYAQGKTQDAEKANAEWLSKETGSSVQLLARNLVEKINKKESLK